MKIIGIILIVIGLIALATGGISWTRREKVVDLGPVQATAERRHSIPLSPLFGGGALAAGIILIVLDTRGRRRV